MNYYKWFENEIAERLTYFSQEIDASGVTKTKFKCTNYEQRSVPYL